AADHRSDRRGRPIQAAHGADPEGARGRSRPCRGQPGDRACGGSRNTVVPLSESLSHNPLLAVVALFGAGLVTSLTPCIYPMIPITAGLLASASPGGTARARAIGLTLTYVTGLAFFYAILGLIAG